MLGLFLAQSWAYQTIDTAYLHLVTRSGDILQDAVIHDASYKIHITSRSDGSYPIHLRAGGFDTLIITNFGYHTLMLDLNSLTHQAHHEVIMEPLEGELEEIVVVGRLDQKEREQQQVIEKISERQLQRTQSRSSADALEQHSNVFVQRSQYGGGSPIIRGFEASRVLLVVDGVRMNNLIYRSGHLQNAITVDANALQQMEVIYGPGSLLYGSDALGGVVHFRTKSPMLCFSEQGAVSGSAMLRYMSAARGLSSNVNVNVGGKHLAYLGSVSYGDFGDLQSGSRFTSKYPDYGKRLFFVEHKQGEDKVVNNDKPYRQIGTSYRQFDMLHKLKWQPNARYSHTLNVQFSTSSDVPRYDQLSEYKDTPDNLRFARWDYGPQKRLLISSRQVISQETSWFDKAIIIAGYQQVGEERISRRTYTLFEQTQEERVHVLSLTADFSKHLGSPSTVMFYGVDLSASGVKSQAKEKNISTGQTRSTLTRYPDDKARMQTFATYAQVRHSWSSAWRSSIGARISDVATQVAYQPTPLISWPQEFLGEGVASDYLNFSWGASLEYQGSMWSTELLLGTAFRAPNIDDLAKIRVKGGQVSVPNTTLEPEKATNVEVSIARKLDQPGRGKISLTGFYTYLRDAIVQEPFPLPNGDEVLLSGEEHFYTVANVNADQAKVYGISANVSWIPAEGWQLAASYNHTQGTSQDAQGSESPMAHIPPNYGRLSAAYQDKSWRIEGVVRFNGEKSLEDYSSNSADNLEYATPEGTLRWTTYNIYGEVDLSDQWQCQLALENLANLHYRPFASGVSAPGRNFSMSLRWLF